MTISRRERLIGVVLFIGCMTFVSICGAKEKNPSILVKIDPRIELMSIIFRMAGNPEYRMGRVASYVQDVDKYFVRFKEHDAVKLAAKLRETRGVSYDAVMGLAIHVTDAFELEERIPFDPQPDTLDKRWTPGLAREFLLAARRFVEDSKFGAFIQAHASLYDLAARRIQAVMEEHGVVDWLDKFYGPRSNAKFELVLGMLNGPANYGARIKLSKEDEILYSILGVWETDGQGKPQFSGQVIPTVVHEFCHSYCNPLVDRHASALQASGIEIFKRVETAMNQMAYGNWLTMMRESLVRASVIRFLHAKFGEARAKKGIQNETQKQFFWIGELSDLLGEYEQDRSTYPSLDIFFPRVTAFFNSYVDRIDQDVQDKAKERQDKLETLKAKSPKILGMVPPAGSQNVDPNLEAIVITFDRPMKDKQWSVMRLSDKFPKMKGTVYYDKTRTIFTIPVELNPDTEYEFGLNAEGYLAFASEAGDPLYPVLIRFKTRKVNKI